MPEFHFPTSWQGWIVTLVAALMGMIGGGFAMNLTRRMVGGAMGSAGLV